MTTREGCSYTVEPESLEHYREAAFTLADIASAGFNVSLKAQTISAWESAFAFIKTLDTAVDLGNESIKSEAFDYFRATFGNDGYVKPASTIYNQPLEEIVSELRPQLTDQQASDFLRKCTQIFDVVVEREHHATEVLEYGMTSRQIGQLTASMLAVITDRTDRLQPGYSEFLRFLRRMSRASNVVDSVADLRRDYSEGNTQIKPTVSNHIRLLATASSDFKDSFGYLGVNIFKLIKPTIQTISGYKPRRSSLQSAGSTQTPVSEAI